MHRQLKHIIVLMLLMFSATELAAQVAMPDTVCVGMSRIYKVAGVSPLSSYTWTIAGNVQTTTSNELNAAWNTAGVFLVTVQEHAPNGCDGDLRSGLVYVQQKTKADAGKDTVVCFGNDVRLNGSGGVGYQWSPATYLSNAAVSNPVLHIPVAGTYSYVLNATNNNVCHSTISDTVLVTILPQAHVFVGNDTTIGINQSLQLHAIDISNSGFTNYTWSPSIGLNDWLVANPLTNNLNEDVTYAVTASTAKGCIATDNIRITVSRVGDIFVPTAFTPNGVNKLLHAIPIGIKEFKYFAIYNRYGQLMFKTNNPAIGWDGNYKSMAQNSAAFVWVAEGIAYNGKVITKKGSVVLVR